MRHSAQIARPALRINVGWTIRLRGLAIPAGRLWVGGALAFVMAAPVAQAAVRVTLRTGFSYDCLREEQIEQGTVRLFLLPDAPRAAAGSDYIDVAANRVLTVEAIADPVIAAPEPVLERAGRPDVPAATLTQAEMHELLARAGEQHHIDEDLLASVVKAESGGHTLAVSRTGARGLMQLMPSTASGLGVHDAFEPAQNISGGTAYLDQMLTRYHDNLAWALAAYNAGPAAVDRYHGIPPYRETRLYVARVIREFNHRKQASRIAAAHDRTRGE